MFPTMQLYSFANFVYVPLSRLVFAQSRSNHGRSGSRLGQRYFAEVTISIQSAELTLGVTVSVLVSR